MKKHLSCLFFATLALALAAFNFAGQNGNPLGKYAPGYQQVLVLVGQDNESVGGNGDWQNGYVDTIGKPAGITHYIYFTEGKTNSFGGKFAKGTVDGLNSISNWKAGPMCMRCYLESKPLQNTLIHLSISMEHDDEPLVAKGDYDHNIQELLEFMQEFSHFPFLLRIGYEFEGSWNSYEPKPFIAAWRRIVDTLRANDVRNFATVLASSTVETKPATWETYWPGDDYVDWIGYSYWANGSYDEAALAFARKKRLPVLIAETTPRGFYLDLPGSENVWTDWFEHFFRHVEKNDDVIKGISYINANWNEQLMWQNRGWGNTQLQDNPKLRAFWLKKISEPRYLHGTDNIYRAIGFNPTSQPQ